MSTVPMQDSHSSCLYLRSVPFMHSRGGAEGRRGGSGTRSQTIEERTNGMRKLDGYFPLYWDERTGSLFLEIPRLNSDFLYTTGLAAGLGSNDLGLDRGQEGRRQDREVRARRAEDFHDAEQPDVPLVRARMRRSSGRLRGFVREVGAVGLHCGGGERRSCAGGCDGISWCATGTGRRAR